MAYCDDRVVGSPAYIGDGAYVRYDGFNFWLTTSNGIETTNEICLEPAVWDSLLEYVMFIKSREEEVKEIIQKGE